MWSRVLFGVARVAVGVAALVVALVLSDWIDVASKFGLLIAISVVYGIARAFAGSLERPGRRFGSRIVTGSADSAFKGARFITHVGYWGFFLGAVVLGLFFGDVHEWLSRRGGGGALYLSAALALVALLGVSAIARVLVAGLVSLSARGRAWLASSTASRRWEGYEAAAFSCAVVVSLYALTLGLIGVDTSVTYRYENGERIAPGQATADLRTASPDAVLQALAPVLVYTEDEGWYPRRVDQYLQDADVLTFRGVVLTSDPSVDKLEDTCPTSARPCLVLRNTTCPESPACAPWRFSFEKLRGQTVRDDRVVAYSHLLTRDEVHGFDWEGSPWRRELFGIAQYFLFAPQDEWVTPVGIGLGQLIKKHVSDWEHVTVGYGATGPLFVGLSAHCGGSWRAFDDVYVEGDTSARYDRFGPRLHVLAAVADGSHAMYFDPNDSRSPDSLGCENRRHSGWMRTAAYLANVRDRTADDIRILITPLTGGEADHVLRFPVYWGIHNRVSVRFPLVGERGEPTGTIARPAGPESPSRKAIYRDPLRTIFCGDTWRHDGDRFRFRFSKRKFCRG